MAGQSDTVRGGQLRPSILLVLGATQGLLIALALARILEPGWSTFGPVGVLAGLGMAAIALIAVRQVRGDRPALSVVAARIGAIAGLTTAFTWMSVLGGTFYTDDSVRVGVVLMSDCVFAVVLVAAARFRDANSGLPGLSLVATILCVRVGFELAVYVVDPSGSGMIPTLVLAVSVLVGWIVLAAWEIALGISLMRRQSHQDRDREPSPYGRSI